MAFMRRSVLAFLGVAALAGTAFANGRPAGTSTINFREGSPQHVIAGMTFGFLRSDDGGTTWKWMCEKAINYGGTFDPDYAYTSSGAIFATTFDGLQVMRDDCTFAAAPSGNTNVSAVQVAPDGDVFYTAADMNDGKIYKSTDDGMTFPTVGSPGANNDWWDSLLVAPSDATRVYLTGYHFIKRCSNNGSMVCMNANDCGGAPATCDSIKVQLLFKSDNGGQTYTPMTQTGLTMSNLSTVDVVGIDPTNKDTVYLHVSIENGTLGDSIYKSTNGGTSWTKIVTTMDTFGQWFLVRSNGDLIVATQTLGSQKSTNGGTSWTPMPNAPHINCLVENPGDHSVWACTHNFDSPGIPMDGYGIMKTTDLVNWTGVLRYQDINGVVECAPGTTQHDECVASFQGKPSVWCCLEQQLGITDTSVDCTGTASCDIVPDGAGNDGGNTMVHPDKPGCCNAGGSAPGAALLAAGTGLLLWRRRRK